MAFGLVSAACGGDEVREENLERLRLLQLEFVSIEPGAFAMGTSGAQAQYLRQREMWDELSRAEQPVREVVIERGFYLGKYEVTQAQWTAAMGTWPWVAKEHVALGEDRPAVYVSWRDAQDFVRRLNEWAGVEKEIYRLPTEAEWEYACRAGSEGLWFFGDEVMDLGAYAWYRDNAWEEGIDYAQAVGGSGRMRGGCTICTGMCGSGVQTGGLRRMGRGLSRCCAGGRFSTGRRMCGRL
jgi:formylglycine-generating enzyme required for sulfatase activity